jgi:hypothetical protein
VTMLQCWYVHNELMCTKSSGVKFPVCNFEQLKLKPNCQYFPLFWRPHAQSSFELLIEAAGQIDRVKDATDCTG